MTKPMSDERLAEIRRAWDGVDATSHRVKVSNSRTPGQLLHALCRASRDVPALLAEVERLHAELSLAFSPGMYLDIQKVLDGALGTSESDGAGAGIVADVQLVADRMRSAEAERDRLAEQVQHIRKVRAEWSEAAARAQAQRDRADERRDVTGVVRENAWATAYLQLGSEIDAALDGTEAGR